jgi:hypothetical protein
VAVVIGYGPASGCEGLVTCATDLEEISHSCRSYELAACLRKLPVTNRARDGAGKDCRCRSAALGRALWLSLVPWPNLQPRCSATMHLLLSVNDHSG